MKGAPRNIFTSIGAVRLEFRDRSPGKGRLFPFSKDGPENSKGVVAAAFAVFLKLPGVEFLYGFDQNSL